MSLSEDNDIEISTQKKEKSSKPSFKRKILTIFHG